MQVQELKTEPKGPLGEMKKGQDGGYRRGKNQRFSRRCKQMGHTKTVKTSVGVWKKASLPNSGQQETDGEL